MTYPTNPIYKLAPIVTIGGKEGEPSVFKAESNGVVLCIPFDTENTDYQEYLEWVADGGVPEAAE
tara:strand:- start:1606 stop:1800 length:195 start_codon:yes stop_codon:yes gene_type:complete